MKPKIVVVLGPTAVGKSDVAMELALQMNGEIINADSQQVYRQMNIGTAKPSRGECETVPHHLIDIVDPDEEFNVARYRELAAAGVHDIQKGKPAIVCGGTGLYIKRSREDCSLAQHKTRKSEQRSLWRRPSMVSDRFTNGLSESILQQRRGFIPMTGSELFAPWKFTN